MREQWAPPAQGWPSFDENGKRVDDLEDEAPAFTLDPDDSIGP